MILLVPIRSGSAVTTPGTPGVDMTGLDIVRLALLKIGVASPVDTIDGLMADVGLAELNMLLDQWNADRTCAFQTTFPAYTLTPSLSPHTIGPTGTFVVVQRPVTIEGATLLWPDAPTRVELTMRDRAWWREQTQPALTTNFPSDLFYEPTWPNGALYFWPVPTVAYQVELWSRGLLEALTLTSRLSAPPGYRSAIVQTLAEQLVPPMRVPMPDGLPESARRARTIVGLNNPIPIPRLQTRDAGMPGGCGGGFNYLTGE